MADKIPDGWRKVKIDEVCSVLKGNGLSKDNLDKNGNNKCILYGELYTVYPEIIKNVRSRTNINHGITSKKGDLLIPGSTTTIGLDLARAVALNEEGVLLGGDINILRKKDNSYNSNYLAYYLSNVKKIEIAKMTQGITIVHLYGKHLREIELILPSEPEQEKIAEILSTVDEDIEETENIISKFMNIKNGLMQTLFLNGIGHTKFKKESWYYDKKIRIPAKWKLVLLDSVAKRGSGHTPNIQLEVYYNGGIKWVSLADSKKLDNVYISETSKEISDKGIENSSAVKYPPGVVILSRDAGVGKSAITKTEMAVSQHFMVWQCGNQLDNHFLYYYLQYNKSLFEAVAVGTTIKTIGLSFFKKFKIILPSLKEQKKIASILLSIDFSIQFNKRKKEHLLNLKKSLMQKLLSGEIRVKVK